MRTMVDCVPRKVDTVLLLKKERFIDRLLPLQVVFNKYVNLVQEAGVNNCTK